MLPGAHSLVSHCCRYYKSLTRSHQETFQGHLVTFLAEPQAHEKTRAIWVDWMHKVCKWWLFECCMSSVAAP